MKVATLRKALEGVGDDLDVHVVVDRVSLKATDEKNPEDEYAWDEAYCAYLTDDTVFTISTIVQL